MIVTDLFPLPPWTDWVESVADLARRRRGRGGRTLRDSHAALRSVGGPPVQVPRCRQKTAQADDFNERWPNLDLPVEAYGGELPFEPVMVEHQLVDPTQRWSLLRRCNVDPAVHPVWRFKGGEQAALARWQAFKEKGLSGYARRRNNAADASNVSRMSAYIHYGMISPMKIAREAAEVGTKSAEKYLDELLVFREHPWHHIYATPEPYGVHNLPNGLAFPGAPPLTTREPTLHVASTPARGGPRHVVGGVSTVPPPTRRSTQQRPDDVGKALTLWTDDVEQSMAYGQALNGAYALDGRDPSSVVGVQWCHGLFDRPFHPPAPILGLVR